MLRTPMERFTEALEAHGYQLIRGVARCPAHDDGTPSMTVDEAPDGKVLVNCHANCPTIAIVQAIGLQMRDLFPNDAPAKAAGGDAPDPTFTRPPDQLYHYYDDTGVYAYTVCKWLPDAANPKKYFRQWIMTVDATGRPTNKARSKKLGEAKRWLYRMPQLAQARMATPATAVYIAEGEKDVDALVAAGHIATCNPQGAGKWKHVADVAATVLRGANVIIITDKDDVGYKHAAEVATALARNAASIRIVEAATGKDAADHLGNGHTIDEFVPVAGGDSAVTTSEWCAHIQNPTGGIVLDAPLTGSGGSGNGRGDADLGGDVPARRREIMVEGRQPRDVMYETIEVLMETNDPPTLFCNLGEPTRLRFVASVPRLELFSKDMMAVRCAEVADWVTIGKKGGVVPAAVPASVVSAVLSNPAHPYPPISGLATMPIVRPDGKIHMNGYDGDPRRPDDDPDATHTYVACTAKIPDFANEPTAAELADAVALIDELFDGFPFEEQADRANAFALLFTPLMRPAVRGKVPMAIITSPKQGSGKSFLADVISHVVTGEPITAMPWLADDDEMRKTLLTMLVAGFPFIVFDNLTGRLRSDALAGMLTNGSLTGRLLGTNQTAKAPDRAVWVATGNNIEVDTDFARRCYTISIDPKTSDPQGRKFSNPNLLGWALTNRGRILAAMLTMFRAWWVADCPMPQDVPANAQYAEWVRVVGGILEHAGVPGLMGNAAKFKARADTEDVAMSKWLTAIHEWRNAGTTRDEEFTARDIEAVLKKGEDGSMLKEEELGVISTVPEKIHDAVVTRRGGATAIGRALSRSLNTRYGDTEVYVAQGKIDRSGANRFRIVVPEQQQHLDVVPEVETIEVPDHVPQELVDTISTTPASVESDSIDGDDVDGDDGPIVSPF